MKIHHHYIWVIITPEDTILSYERKEIERVFKRMGGNREFRRYKDGSLDEVIDSRYDNDNHMEDSVIIMHRGFDLFNPRPNFSQKLLKKI